MFFFKLLKFWTILYLKWYEIMFTDFGKKLVSSQWSYLWLWAVCQVVIILCLRVRVCVSDAAPEIFNCHSHSKCQFSLSFAFVNWRNLLFSTFFFNGHAVSSCCSARGNVYFCKAMPLTLTTECTLCRVASPETRNSRYEVKRGRTESQLQFFFSFFSFFFPTRCALILH